ncbi:MAG TPA: M23 family metallopeptidase [Candidatus Binatia bacterium]|nr:M23 family metallopeptidase [Candidatus Binatia bacterium]
MAIASAWAIFNSDAMRLLVTIVAACVIAAFALFGLGTRGERSAPVGEPAVSAPESALPGPEIPVEPDPAPIEVVLRARETLEGALRRADVSGEDAAGLTAALGRVVDLRRLRPGERITIARGADGGATGATHWRSVTERYALQRFGDERGAAWTAERVRVPVETRVEFVGGQVDDSLFASMERAGERALLAARFVGLFEWDFDFAADALPGDRFRALVEKRYVDGVFAGYGDILVARYETAGRAPMTAVRFAGPGGRADFYDANGRSVRKMFLRAPLDFTRITSGFSHARRHPILGGLRPHLAIDYGAPVGTPVRAVADGVVEFTGWRGGYGMSITLRHARGYGTMYNHLSRAHVRRGQRVRQREIIGRVGSTGLSTGPHLDYRVIKNGRFVNPLTEKFIPGAPVPREHLRPFQLHASALLDRLEEAGARHGRPTAP